MTDSTNAKGQRAFLEDGSEVEIVGVIDEEIVVRDIVYEDDTGAEYPSETARLVERVFTSPPHAKVDAEIAEKQARLQELQESVWAMEADVRDAKKRIAEREAILMRDRALSHLVDFIEGKVTHFVIAQYGRIYIETAADALKERGDRPWDCKLKLLTLYGATDGNLEWKLNEYRDGSGGNSYEVIPCCSLEEAQQAAREHLAIAFQKERPWYLDSAIASADALGLEVPMDVRRRFIEYKREQAQKELTEAQEKAKKAQEQLAALALPAA